jgi:hypothetical protein
MRYFIFTIFTIILLSILSRAQGKALKPVPKIFARQQNCNDSGSLLCDIPGATSSFCCPASTECIPLEKATSVICCKIGEICDQIHPIACPANPSPAQQCGADCCPIGFECDGTGKKCVMKPENLPERYKKKPSTPGNSNNNTSGVHAEGQTISEPVVSSKSSKCPEFTAKGIVVGFFPGMVVGAALMLLWTKICEARTRRRSIKSFGVLTNTFPSRVDLVSEKTVIKKPSIPTGFAHSQPPQIESTSTFSPLSANFRSPNLGPPVPPLRISRNPSTIAKNTMSSRGRDSSPPKQTRDTSPRQIVTTRPRNASPPSSIMPTPKPQSNRSYSYASPQPQEPAIKPSQSLRSARSHRSNSTVSRCSEEDSYRPPPKTHQNFSRPGNDSPISPPGIPDIRISGLTLFSDISPVNAKRTSFDTGYSASVYNDGNEMGAFPFSRTETAIPPIPKPAPLFYRKAGGPLPRPPMEEWRQIGVGGRV